jgi:hypothetical protein
MIKEKIRQIEKKSIQPQTLLYAGLASALLPLALLSPRLRRAALRKEEKVKGISITRSRISNSIVELRLAHRMLISSPAVMDAMSRVVVLFAQVASPIDSFSIVERWEDEKEQVKSMEVKRRAFVDEAMSEIRDMRDAVEEGDHRTLEIEPRGMRFTLVISIHRKQEKVFMDVRIHGDQEALERFGELYLADA